MSLKYSFIENKPSRAGLSLDRLLLREESKVFERDFFREID